MGTAISMLRLLPTLLNSTEHSWGGMPPALSPRTQAGKDQGYWGYPICASSRPHRLSPLTVWSTSASHGGETQHCTHLCLLQLALGLHLCHNLVHVGLQHHAAYHHLLQDVVNLRGQGREGMGRDGKGRLQTQPSLRTSQECQQPLLQKRVGDWHFPERHKSSPILPSAHTAPAAGCPESKRAAMVLSTWSHSPISCLYLCSRGHLPQGQEQMLPTGPPGTGLPPERPGLTQLAGTPWLHHF